MLDRTCFREFMPADLLVFAGAGFESRCIAWMSCRPWQLLQGQWFSHIGICARGPAGNVLLFESTTLCELPCEVLQRKVHGTQAHEPSRRIDEYQGKVWRLRLAPRETLTDSESARLSDFLVANLGTPYDYDGALISGTFALRRCRMFASRADVFFCSDLVLAALKDVRRVDHDLNPRSFSPGRVVRDLTYWGTYQPLARRGGPSERLK
ncbi:MAG TPA: hypothetical protein VMV69_30515 [Pirellulales bacterium]|nr:hypothetical protein [Pirellulales bacterium]